MHYCQFGAVYNAPACDVQRRRQVGVHPTAGRTDEKVLFANTTETAMRAGLGCVGGIDVFDSQSLSFGLVLNERLELTKRPAGHHPVHVAVADSGSLADVLQQFHADRTAVCLDRFSYQSLTQNVILVSYSPILVSRETAKDGLRSTGAFALQTCSDTCAVFLELSSSLSIMQSPGRSGGCVTDSHVNPERESATRRFFGIGYDDVDIPVFPLTNNCSRSGSLSDKSLSLELSEKERDVYASIHHGQRYGFIRRPISENAGIIVNTCRPKQLGFPFASASGNHSTRYTTDSADSKIGGQRELIANHSVSEMVESDVVRFVFFESQHKRSVASLGKYPACFGQCVGHYRRRNHLATDCSLTHSEYVIISISNRQDYFPAKAGGIQLPKERQ